MLPPPRSSLSSPLRRCTACSTPLPATDPVAHTPRRRPRPTRYPAAAGGPTTWPRRRARPPFPAWQPATTTTVLHAITRATPQPNLQTCLHTEPPPPPPPQTPSALTAALPAADVPHPKHPLPLPPPPPSLASLLVRHSQRFSCFALPSPLCTPLSNRPPLPKKERRRQRPTLPHNCPC